MISYEQGSFGKHQKNRQIPLPKYQIRIQKVYLTGNNDIIHVKDYINTFKLKRT